MNLNINIDTDKNCKVIIQDNSLYLPEDATNIAKGKFKHSETTSIVILLHNKIAGTELKDPTYYSNINNINVPITFDGYFTIYYVVLPNKKWYDKENNKQHGSAFALYSNIYFEDSGNIYKLVNGQIESATINEVILINPTNTTISIINKNYVSICYLRLCYINLCKLIFNNRNITACSNKNTIDSELVYKRDLAWMAMNIVKYMTDLNQLDEAERIIEQVTSCNGICNNEQNQTNRINSSGCGCSK